MEHKVAFVVAGLLPLLLVSLLLWIRLENAGVAAPTIRRSLAALWLRVAVVVLMLLVGCVMRHYLSGFWGVGGMLVSFGAGLIAAIQAFRFVNQLLRKHPFV